MELGELEIYQIARKCSQLAWEIYNTFDWRTKKVLGDQFITAVDSVGANIAEGYGRYHYLDRNKFNYNARGSLVESLHWLELLYERKFAEQQKYEELKQQLSRLSVKLNNYINATRNAKGS